MAIDKATQDKYNKLALQLDQIQNKRIGRGFEAEPNEANKIRKQMEALEPKVVTPTPDIHGIIQEQPGLLGFLGSASNTVDPEKEVTDLLNSGVDPKDSKVVALLKQISDKVAKDKVSQSAQTDLDSLKSNATAYIALQTKNDKNSAIVDQNTKQIKELQTKNIILTAKGESTAANDKQILALQNEVNATKNPVATPVDPKTGKPVVTTTTPADTSTQVSFDGKMVGISTIINEISKDPVKFAAATEQLRQMGYVHPNDKPDVVAQELFKAMTAATAQNLSWEDYVPVAKANSTNKIGQLGVPAQETKQNDSTVEYLTAFARNNGIQIAPNTMTEYEKNVSAGSTSVDAITLDLMKNVITKSFPAYTDALYSPSAGTNGTPGMSGTTVSDLAQPYKDLLSRVFGINSKDIPLNDPRLAKMMQYVDPKTGKPAQMPLYQAYSDVVQKDPGWGKTQDAWANLGAKFDPILGDIGGAPAEFRNTSYENGL